MADCIWGLIMKVCIECGESKELSQFKFRTDTKKYRNSCKECDKTYFAARYESKKDIISAQSKIKYAENPEPTKARSKKWKAANPDKVAASIERCRESSNARKRDRYKNDQEYRKADQARSKKWKKNNRTKVNKHEREKRAEDIQYRLRDNIRSRFRQALRGITKGLGAIKALGCTIEYLKQYLESKFQLGMSWDNYGFYGWHIDHIVPLASFDLTDINQVKKACHYTNLQPLWAEDNLRKGAKII